MFFQVSGIPLHKGRYIELKKKLYVLKQYLRARLNDFLELCRDMDTDRLRVTKLDL